MPPSSHILLLIGPPAAGKTTVGRLIRDRRGIPLIEIGPFRDRRASPATIAHDLASTASTGPVVFECSGAGDDFEFVVRELELRGVRPFVCGLFAPRSVLVARLARRPATPKGGGNWEKHVDWVAWRLRMVPMDADVWTDSPEDAAEAVLAAWEESAMRPAGPDAGGVITFSQLKTRQICPLQYTYRFVWHAPPPQGPPLSLRLGEAVHESLAWLFSHRRPAPTSADLDQEFDARIAKLQRACPDSLDDVRGRGRRLLQSFYERHFILDDQQTLAVEADVSLAVADGLSFVGRADRVARTSTGELEITEFKMAESKRGSIPRVPDLLQPVAYAASVICEGGAARAFASLHFLEQDRAIRLLVARADVERVRLALARWLNTLRRRDHHARPGYHCRHCSFRTICPWAAPDGPAGGSTDSIEISAPQVEHVGRSPAT